MPFRNGDAVTILPPYTNDPVIIEHQHFGIVAGRTEAGYIVELDATWPPNECFGPFPAERLAKGWRSSSGRCRP